MKILIVDDEELGISRVKRMLNTLEFDDIREANNTKEALELAKNHQFDVAFLDINMPSTDGLELAYELKYQHHNLAIIFQTAYSEHALKAFDIGAVGYLVKPFSIDQLKATLQRITTSNATNLDLRLLSKTGESYYLLKPEEIYYIKADLSEVIIRSQKGFSYHSKKISDLETMLVPHHFVRIHRSYIINIDKIKEIFTIEQSKLRFKFKDIGDEIESSKEGAKSFRENFSI